MTMAESCANCSATGLADTNAYWLWRADTSWSFGWLTQLPDSWTVLKIPFTVLLGKADWSGYEEMSIG